MVVKQFLWLWCVNCGFCWEAKVFILTVGCCVETSACYRLRCCNFAAAVSWHLSRAVTCKTRKRKVLHALLVVNKQADNCSRACLEFDSAHCKRAERNDHAVFETHTYIEHGTTVSDSFRVITCCWLPMSGLLSGINIWPFWPAVCPRQTWLSPLIFRWGVPIVFSVTNEMYKFVVSNRYN